MAQAGYTPIQLYFSTTAAAVPLAANLAQGELAINIADGKLYYENSSGVVTLLAGAGGAGIVAGSNTQLQFNNSGVFGASANLTWDGTTLSSTQVNITGQGTLRLQDTTGGEYVGLRSPSALGASYTLTFPADDGTSGQALITDGSGVLSWSTAASGDVYGPASSTDNAVARFDSTTGKLLQNSVVLIGDTGAVTGVTDLAASGSVTLSGGTANGVTYLNGSKVLTSGSALTFDGSGGLGVGVAVATELFDGAATNPKIKLSATSTGYATSQFVNSSGSSYFGRDNAAGNFFGIANGTVVYSSSSDPIGFFLGASEQMRLTSTGLGIGTSSPSTKLVASGTTTAIDSNGQIFATVTDTVAADKGGQIMMGGYYTGTTTTSFGGIAAKKENGTSGSFSGYLQFLTSTGGSGNTEKARIDSSGQFILGPFGGNGNAVFAGSSSPGYTNQPGTNLLIKSGDGSGSGFSYMAFFTSPQGSSGTTVNTAVERMRITEAGNLGIGTASPISLVNATFSGGTVSGTHSMAFGYPYAANLQLKSTNAGTSVAVASVGLYGNPERTREFAFYNQATDARVGYLGYQYGSGGVITDLGLFNALAGALTFSTNNTEVGRFTSAGRLGMGTVTPLSSIGIFGGTGNALGITIQPSGWNYFNRIGPNGTSGNSFYISQNWNAEANTVDNASYGTTAISMNTGDISFWTGATNTVPSTKATIAQSGRVTINNGEYTVIQGSAYGKTPNGTGFSFGYNPSGGGGESQLVWGTGGSTYPFIISSYDGSTVTERARFSTTGYFSIGTTNNLNVLNLIGQSNSGGISWGNYMNVFSEYSSGAAYISSNYYPTYGASGYKTTLTASFGAAGISVSGTGGASNGGLIAFYVNPATSKTAGDAFTPTEVGRFTANGYFKASNNGTYSGATAPSHEFRTTVDGNYTLTVTSSASSPFGFYVGYPSASPNNTTNRFIDCEDSSALRFQVRSNGGIANYSANNVNLSDRREKTNFAPATSYLAKICAIPVQTFNYIGQNLEQDDGLTLGVVAQDVQAVAPELVMESNWASKDAEPKMRLSIYQTDLQYALMKCIQEQQAIIESLKARLDAANL